jgi:hypothetical protein
MWMLQADIEQKNYAVQLTQLPTNSRLLQLMHIILPLLVVWPLRIHLYPMPMLLPLWRPKVRGLSKERLHRGRGRMRQQIKYR